MKQTEEANTSGDNEPESIVERIYFASGNGNREERSAYQGSDKS